MKCPACGFNSFESNDSCPKCAAGLKELKQTYGLAPVVFSSVHRQTLAAEYEAGMSTADGGGGEEGDFASVQYGQQRDESSASPFSFDETPVEKTAGSPASPLDPFAELLESSPQPVKTEPREPATPFPEQGHELSGFSWGDTPEPAAPAAQTPPAAPKKEEDDFASLFGDLGGTKK